MNMHALGRETAVDANAGTERLAQDGFAQNEIASLLRLRQWYQNGGSDRVNVVRHWEFLKFLIMHGKLEA